MDTASTELQTTSFVALGKSGKGAWWRYVLGTVIIIGSYVVLSIILIGVFLIVACGGKVSRIDPVTGLLNGVDPIVNYIALNLSFWFLIFFAFLVIRFLHSRSFLSLITPAHKVSLKRIGIGFGLWFGMLCIQTIMASVIFPHDYKYALQSPEFFYFAPIVLFLTPIQCFAEELFFRGYLLQALGKITSSRWWLCGISGVLFAIPHYSNPEVASNPIALLLCYFGIGFLLTYATVRSNSLEIAIGGHIGNNLFDGLICNYENSVLQTRSIFLCTQTHPWFEFSALVVMGAIFCAIIERYVRPKNEPSATS